MKALHRAALTRAYRTLAQGLGGSTVVTALVGLVAALLGSPDALRTAAVTAAIAVGTVIATAVGSFWQGVATGLPEVIDPETEADAQAAGNDLMKDPYTGGRHEA